MIPAPGYFLTSDTLDQVHQLFFSLPQQHTEITTEFMCLGIFSKKHLINKCLE